MFDCRVVSRGCDDAAGAPDSFNPRLKSRNTHYLVKNVINRIILWISVFIHSRNVICERFMSPREGGAWVLAAKIEFHPD